MKNCKNRNREAARFGITRTSLFACLSVGIICISLNACKKPASTQPDFAWERASVYFLLTDRFCNGDTTNDHSYGRITDYGSERLNALLSTEEIMSDCSKRFRRAISETLEWMWFGSPTPTSKSMVGQPAAES